MKTMVRKAGLFIAALIFAVTLSAGTGLPKPAYNECERNTSWSICSIQSDKTLLHHYISSRLSWFVSQFLLC